VKTWARVRERREGALGGEDGHKTGSRKEVIDWALVPKEEEKFL